MPKVVQIILPLFLAVAALSPIKGESVSSHLSDTVNFRIQEVEVIGHQSISAPESPQMSAVEIPLLQLQTIPALGGEIDVMKAIQLLPGVQSASDGETGIHVRGGGADENLILLDGVPLYNVSHAMGMFSVFNADILQNVTLYKGNFPARYGARLSSLVDVEQKTGCPTQWHGKAMVGLIAAKAFVEGPIFTGEQLRQRDSIMRKDPAKYNAVTARTTFALSARRTYYDALLAPLMAAVSATELDGGNANGGYYFYDVNAKLSHRFKNNDRLSASFFMGEDVIYVNYSLSERITSAASEVTGTSMKTKMGMRWSSGNLMTQLQYDHRISDNLLMQLRAHFLRFGYNLDEKLNVNGEEKDIYGNVTRNTFDQSLNFGSKMMDGVLHADFIYTQPKHTLRFGGGYELHTFRPRVGNLMMAELAETIDYRFDTTYTVSTIFGHEAYLYADESYDPVKWFTLNAGLRAELYNIQGTTYPSIEPRLGMRFLPHKDFAIKMSYSYMSQYVHLLSNSSISSPTDLWVPVTDKIPPMHSMQVAAGLSYDIMQQAELSVEGYYKRSTNLVEFKEGASFYGISSTWQEKVAVGDGWSYGIELLLQRKHGPVTGWIGYTWSRTMRQFDREGMVINFGKPFHAKYDREHDLSITLQYRVTPVFEVAGTFVYSTGNRATLATQRYYDPSIKEWVEYISSRNNFQMPDYHRLDLALNWHIPHKKANHPEASRGAWLNEAEHLVSLSVYNVYCHKNPYMMIFDGNDLKQISLFPVLPSLSYTFSF